ncbi:MAG: inosine triphosphate pyrophosphatase isoform [Candidatus Saccharibacteria bacterium]|nr:inosine triphosphate pyrophosphatase isoform [Candidatus Saccharibacteria bacterium]
MIEIFLVTSNPNKLKEWQQIIPPNITMDIADVDLIEIQSDNPEEIITDKARRAYEIVGKPVVVEDVEAGLEKLNGLPGPFIKFFIKKMGDDVLYQLAGQEGERATISCSIAYYDGERMLTVRGDVPGTIVAPRGAAGFGFDITFAPDGQTQTYAEMDDEKKNSLSHRHKAIQLLVEKLNHELI